MVTEKRKRPRFNRLRVKLTQFGVKSRKAMNRGNAAHMFMIFFVSFNSVGAWLIAPQYGFITAGVCSGLYGYLLGNE
jgi:hypothetical protein